MYYPSEFPLSYPSIAPMYSEVDIRGHGSVYYRETKEQELLDRASKDVNSYFHESQSFFAQSLFIATWDRVPLNKTYTSKVSKIPSFVIVS